MSSNKDDLITNPHGVGTICSSCIRLVQDEEGNSKSTYCEYKQVRMCATACWPARCEGYDPRPNTIPWYKACITDAVGLIEGLFGGWGTEIITDKDEQAYQAAHAFVKIHKREP